MAGIVKTIGKALLWMVAGVAVFVSTPLAYYYGTPLLEPAITRKADVIVLLSSGQIDDNWLTPDAAQRLLGALKLYRDNFAPVIISSGSQHQRGLGQAELQADWLTRAAVPASAILVEGRSTRTYESCIEVSGIMRDHGWNSAVIVTSQMDVPRVRLVFAKLGISASFLAVPEFGPPKGLLYTRGFDVFYHASYEYAALILYKFKGWI
jgi:uncharacterized SAM-binding protein YcdF (DUF218 family)